MQQTARQSLNAVIEPGDIGIALPSSPGTGRWPEMRVIGFGIHIDALSKSLGRGWPGSLDTDLLSRPLRDPMVEATMMQVGYTHAGRISDSVLLHAAHMVVHQLLEGCADAASESDAPGVSPLSTSVLAEIRAYILDNIDATISVDALARHVGISRHHFSRRFRRRTGQSPYQYVLDLKLEAAAQTMRSDQRISIVDVANMVGYRNPAQFSQAFRKRFGQAPRFWRMNAQ